MTQNPKQYQSTIDRVDCLIRQNNKKYLDQKSQIQYEKALEAYQKHKQRSILKSYAQQIKEGNKKAIEKKLKYISLSKAQSRVSAISKQKVNPIKQNDQKPQLKTRQKLSEKQLKKVQKAIEARAERHLQQMQLEKINKRLDEQKRKTRLYELTETCQKLLSKSHKRIPPISQKIPAERRVLLQEYSKRAQEEVAQLDHIISGLVQKSKLNKNSTNTNPNHNKKHKNPDKDSRSIQKDISREDIFSQEFQIEFMNQILSGRVDMRQMIESRQKKGLQRNEDILFTKSASELFQMNYIPIQ